MLDDGITSLTLADRRPAAELLADAFLDNPAHAFIYPDEATRRARLEWLMAVNLGAQFAVGRSFAQVAEDRSIMAMAFWHAPGAPKASLFQLMRYGFFAMPVRQGWSPFQRMLTAVEAIETRRLASLRGRESWYLNNMVVAADHRGRGLGARLLDRQLREVVAPSGAPASLSTQKPENVNFYERLGFTPSEREGLVRYALEPEGIAALRAAASPPAGD